MADETENSAKLSTDTGVITLAIRRELSEMLGSAVDFGKATAHAYSVDNSKRRHCPDGVLFPETAEQVQQAVAIAYREGIPVITRGRGTGTTGAALAETGGLVLSTERLAGGIRINAEDRTAVTGPGTLNGEVQAAAACEGLFWPPDPSSSAYCSVGGNLATAAAGPRHFRHGGARTSVRQIKLVTGTGELVTLGSSVGKSAVGYDLVGLVVGSEGTLGVIVEATLALKPLARQSLGVTAEFMSVEDCLDAMDAISNLPDAPSAVEFLDTGALDLIRSRHNNMVLPETKALLMMLAEGDACQQAAQAMQKACFGTVRSTIVNSTDQLWEARKALSPLMRDVLPVKINEDITVPPSRLAEFMRKLGAIVEAEQVRNINFGHIADGNLHVNFLYDPEVAGARDRTERAVHRMFDLVVKLGGSISGEHGVGIAKRDCVVKEISPEVINLMKGIKATFDPKGIMNPGKIFLS